MKTRVLLAIASGAILMSVAAPAENYYVRNRPFTQVIKAGGEAMVDTEAFLRALGMNWSVDGNVVTLTEKPAANPSLGPGSMTYKYGDHQMVLEGTPRGGGTYVSLRALAKLVDYGVRVNTDSGTVDVSKARFASAAEKQLVGEAAAAQAAEKKATEEAWEKKAAELKEKREAKAEEGSKDAATEEGKDGADASKDGADATKEPAKDKEPAKGKGKKPPKETPAVTPPPVEAKPEDAKPEVKEPVKEARLEVFRTDASPDYSTGIVTITCEVKNMGDAPSKSVSGTLKLTGPDRAGGVTDNTNAAQRVWFTKSMSGPSIQPGASWQFSEKYRHPSGNAMPIGTLTADFKLNATK